MSHVAIVTGATAGIGRSIALKLAQQGKRVIAIGTNPERGAKVVQAIAKIENAPEARFVPLDLTDAEQVDKALTEIVQKEGGVEILVNNAGVTKDGLLLRMKEEQWQQVIDTNLTSCYRCSKALLRSMMKARKGSIINISSVVGVRGNPGQTNYCASKAGMIGFTKSLAQEVASRGITVNCVAPGFIDTNMTQELTEKQREAITTQIPLGRIGAPEDIAEAVAFLASPAAKYITGHVLTVDGGMTM